MVSSCLDALELTLCGYMPVVVEGKPHNVAYAMFKA